MTEDEKLRLDYDTTVRVLLALADTRFKLLGLVPTIAAAAIAIVSRGGTTPAELMALGTVGLVATLGILVYELRNTQLYDAAVARAGVLEGALGLEGGGLFGGRPREGFRLFGTFEISHDRGLGLVYAAALGAWAYLVGWGFAAAVHLAHPKAWGGGAGIVVGLVVLADITRLRAPA
ncbi:MAG TPA: hypothetical protein VMT59_04575 [Gaiellaceae bacterium]|nr:hypothetical protein [Gaiellaceae bacterium]